MPFRGQKRKHHQEEVPYGTVMVDISGSRGELRNAVLDHMMKQEPEWATLRSATEHFDRPAEDLNGSDQWVEIAVSVSDGDLTCVANDILRNPPGGAAFTGLAIEALDDDHQYDVEFKGEKSFILEFAYTTLELLPKSIRNWKVTLYAEDFLPRANMAGSDTALNSPSLDSDDDL